MKTVVLIIIIGAIEIAIFLLVDELKKRYWWKKTASPDNRYHCYYIEAKQLKCSIRKQKSHLMMRLHMVESGLCHAPLTQKERDELKAIIEELESKIYEDEESKNIV